MRVISIVSDTREKTLSERKQMPKAEIKSTRKEKKSVTTHDKNLPHVFSVASIIAECEKFLTYILNASMANSEKAKQIAQLISAPEPRCAEFTPTSAAKEGVIEKTIIADEVSRYPM